MNNERHLTFVEAIEIERRMTKQSQRGFCTIACSGCPFYYENNIHHIGCAAFKAFYPEETERILIEWNELHPMKTRLQDFFEKNPNAPKRKNGLPTMCVSGCGYCEECENDDCTACWNEPIDEEK